MNIWNKLDLEVLDMRDKIMLLTEEFNVKNGKQVENYNQRLSRFLDRKLKKESDLIFRKQIFLTISSMAILNRKVYK